MSLKNLSATKITLKLLNNKLKNKKNLENKFLAMSLIIKVMIKIMAKKRPSNK